MRRGTRWVTMTGTMCILWLCMGVARAENPAPAALAKAQAEFERREVALEEAVLDKEYEMLRLRKLELEIEREMAITEPGATNVKEKPVRPALVAVGMRISVIERLITENRQSARRLLDRKIKLSSPAPGP